jgi:hypothetical protein
MNNVICPKQESPLSDSRREEGCLLGEYFQEGKAGRIGQLCSLSNNESISCRNFGVSINIKFCL